MDYVVRGSIILSEPWIRIFLNQCHLWRHFTTLTYTEISILPAVFYFTYISLLTCFMCEISTPSALCLSPL